MRDNLSVAKPRCVLLDTTFDTNSNKYKLIVLAYRCVWTSKTRVASMGLLQTESEGNVRSFLESFRKLHAPDYFMVDKNFGQMELQIMLQLNSLESCNHLRPFQTLLAALCKPVDRILQKKVGTSWGTLLTNEDWNEDWRTALLNDRSITSHFGILRAGSITSFELFLVSKIFQV